MSSQPPYANSSAEAVLADLDPEQRQVALALRGPVCVLAGAGTGKTRAITHRIAYGVRTGTYTPSAVLAVTFTARAAGEMRTRLRGLGVEGVQARTFHAAALRQLSYFLPRAEQRPVPRLLGHKAPYVAQAAGRLGMEVDRAAIRDLAAEIEWAKVNMLGPQRYVHAAERAGRGPVAGNDPVAVSRLMTSYEQVLAAEGAMDFEDVLLATAGLITVHPDVADEVRRRYRFFVVDEYQDVSPVQQRLLDLWLGERGELCVVGDPNQTIYSFAGASATHLLDFPRRRPGAAVIRLVRDYRSTPQVVSLANSLLRRAGRRALGGIAPLELIAQRPAGPAPHFAVHADDEAEAAWVARRIARLIGEGAAPGQIAVLFRTNVQSVPFEQALAEEGVAYLVRGGERFFSRREVRDAIVLLRGAARAAGGAGLGADVRDALANLGWREEAPTERGAVRERWESLQALVALAEEMETVAAAADPPVRIGLAQYVAELEARAAAQHAPSVAGVTLASLHAAKGLEWDTVFLVGLSDGLVPISLAEGTEQIAEERRLLYVGITRARERLVLSYARARNPGARAVRRPSQFLAPIWPPEGSSRGRSRDDRDGATGGGRGGVDGDREAGGGNVRGRAQGDGGVVGGADVALLETLTRWRTETARRLDRPAFAVVSDAALRQIATRRPRDAAGLVRIDGIGPTKLQAWGQDLLRLVADAGA